MPIADVGQVIDPLHQAAAMLGIAQNILSETGQLAPVAFLFLANGDVRALDLHHESRQELEQAMTHLRDQALASGAIGVAVLSEVWTAALDQPSVTKADLLRPPSRRSDRAEAITCMALSREGRSRVWFVRFSRHQESIQFDKIGVVDGKLPRLMTPIARAWGS